MSDPFSGLFGAETAPHAARVLDLIDSDSEVSWSPQMLADGTGLSLATVMVIVARLTVAGHVDHDGLGQGYRARHTGANRRAG